MSSNSNAFHASPGAEPNRSNRLVVMRLVHPIGGAPRTVEFRIDDAFIERLRQLRTLVPTPTSLNRNRDLVIDKVRVRLSSALWRRVEMPLRASSSCLVVSNEGVFHCGAKDSESGHKLMSCSFSIARLMELHEQRPAGETLYIYSGFFINDEPTESEAGRWVAQMHAIESHVQMAEGSSDFDTLHGTPPRAEEPLARAA